MTDPTTGVQWRPELTGRHVLFVHAHPDDETIATGGTIARLVAAGTVVSVLTATRGERGETAPGSAPSDVTADRLTAIRVAELAAALAELGVQQHFWLGTAPARTGDGVRRYVDSGMQWGPDGWAVAADDAAPDALGRADGGEVVADVLALLRTIGPELVVSYDARGGYGHPDHVSMHRAARAAAARAGIGFAECLPGPPPAVDRSAVGGDDSDHDSGDEDGEVVAVDTSAQRAQLVRALRCYRTQLLHVADDHLVHVGGQRQELPAVEYYRLR